MIEDKLHHNERLRLECLAQSIASQRGMELPEQIIRRAMEFEWYVATGEEKKQ